jgi:hypothetical protein
VDGSGWYVFCCIMVGRLNVVWGLLVMSVVFLFCGFFLGCGFSLFWGFVEVF